MHLEHCIHNKGPIIYPPFYLILKVIFPILSRRTIQIAFPWKEMNASWLSRFLSDSDEIHAWFNRNAKASSRIIFLFLCWNSEFKAIENISSKTIFLPTRKINQNWYSLSKTDKQIRVEAANVSSVSLYVKTFPFPFPFSLCHEMELKNHCELKPGLSPSGLVKVRHPVYLGKQAHVQS